MVHNKSVEEIYRTGYDAFEGGDYAEANRLAGHCLEASTPEDYWYAGALGLKCWVATLTGESITLQDSAQQISAIDTGADTHWFDGLGALHLGFFHHQGGDVQKSKELFTQASLSYHQQTLQPGQPPEVIGSDPLNVLQATPAGRRLLERAQGERDGSLPHGVHRDPPARPRGGTDPLDRFAPVDA